MYTSGSTGRPKGCVHLSSDGSQQTFLAVEHISLPTRRSRLFQGMIYLFNYLHDDINYVGTVFLYVTFLQTSLLFVDSIVELFSCLLPLIPLVVVVAEECNWSRLFCFDSGAVSNHSSHGCSISIEEPPLLHLHFRQRRKAIGKIIHVGLQ